MDELQHHGVKGMKWGIRRRSPRARKIDRDYKRFVAKAKETQKDTYPDRLKITGYDPKTDLYDYERGYSSKRKKDVAVHTLKNHRYQIRQLKAQAEKLKDEKEKKRLLDMLNDDEKFLTDCIVQTSLAQIID